jgi:hypothetical protein
MKRAGESYSVTSGVELKFDVEEDQDFDWNESFNWTDTEAVVTRYVDEVLHTIYD